MNERWEADEYPIHTPPSATSRRARIAYTIFCTIYLVAALILLYISLSPPWSLVGYAGTIIAYLIAISSEVTEGQ
jgi:hypothetical protein